jgi:hypothetical protein
MFFLCRRFLVSAAILDFELIQLDQSRVGADVVITSGIANSFFHVPGFDQFSPVSG